jgi:hypothetical protein
MFTEPGNARSRLDLLAARGAHHCLGRDPEPEYQASCQHRLPALERLCERQIGCRFRWSSQHFVECL